MCVINKIIILDNMDLVPVLPKRPERKVTIRFTGNVLQILFNSRRESLQSIMIASS